MTVTNYPNGVNVGSELQINGTAVNPLGYATAGKKIAMGTVVVPTGASGTAFASGLTTIDYVDCSPYATVVTVAGYVGAVASASAGNITLIGVSGAGTVSTTSGTATWIAIGS